MRVRECVRKESPAGRGIDCDREEECACVRVRERGED